MVLEPLVAHLPVILAWLPSYVHALLAGVALGGDRGEPGEVVAEQRFLGHPLPYTRFPTARTRRHGRRA